MSFDYEAEAELFPSRLRSSRRRPVGYRRFARAVEAIRFAIEELLAESLAGAWLEVDKDRFDAQAIRRPYEHADYPLHGRDSGPSAVQDRQSAKPFAERADYGIPKGRLGHGQEVPEKQSREEKAQGGTTQASGTDITLRGRSVWAASRAGRPGKAGELIGE